jgi:hypothetical protein
MIPRGRARRRRGKGQGPDRENVAQWSWAFRSRPEARGFTSARGGKGPRPVEGEPAGDRCEARTLDQYRDQLALHLRRLGRSPPRARQAPALVHQEGPPAPRVRPARALPPLDRLQRRRRQERARPHPLRPALVRVLRPPPRRRLPMQAHRPPGSRRQAPQDGPLPHHLHAQVRPHQPRRSLRSPAFSAERPSSSTASATSGAATSSRAGARWRLLSRSRSHSLYTVAVQTPQTPNLRATSVTLRSVAGCLPAPRSLRRPLSQVSCCLLEAPVKQSFCQRTMPPVNVFETLLNQPESFSTVANRRERMWLHSTDLQDVVGSNPATPTAVASGIRRIFGIVRRGLGAGFAGMQHRCSKWRDGRG